MNKQIKVFYRYQTKEEIVESTSLCKIRIFFCRTHLWAFLLFSLGRNVENG